MRMLKGCIYHGTGDNALWVTTAKLGEDFQARTVLVLDYQVIHKVRTGGLLNGPPSSHVDNSREDFQMRQQL